MSASDDHRSRDVLVWFILAIGVLIAVQILAGCTERKAETREKTTTTKDVVQFKATIPFPTGEGIKLLPISGTLTATGSEVAESTAHSETRTAPDTEALVAALGQVVDRIAPAIAATATPWATILGGVGAAATTAATGYLALKKRDQIRETAPRAKQA